MTKEVDMYGHELRDGMLVSAVFAPSKRGDLIADALEYLDHAELYDVWHDGTELVLSPSDADKERPFFTFRAPVADFRDVLVVLSR